MGLSFFEQITLFTLLKKEKNKKINNNKRKKNERQTTQLKRILPTHFFLLNRTFLQHKHHRKNK